MVEYHLKNFHQQNHQIVRNVLASDLGIISKRGNDGTTTVIISDLKTTAPLNGVSIEFFDFQQQSLGIATTGNDGKATFASKSLPFFLIAKSGEQRGYQRLIDGETLGIAIRPLGAVNVSFYSKDEDEKKGPRLYIEATK